MGIGWLYPTIFIILVSLPLVQRDSVFAISIGIVRLQRFACRRSLRFSHYCHHLHLVVDFVDVLEAVVGRFAVASWWTSIFSGRGRSAAWRLIFEQLAERRIRLVIKFVGPWTRAAADIEAFCLSQVLLDLSYQTVNIGNNVAQCCGIERDLLAAGHRL